MHMSQSPVILIWKKDRKILMKFKDKLAWKQVPFGNARKALSSINDTCYSKIVNSKAPFTRSILQRAILYPVTPKRIKTQK